MVITKRQLLALSANQESLDTSGFEWSAEDEGEDEVDPMDEVLEDDGYDSHTAIEYRR